MTNDAFISIYGASIKSGTGGLKNEIYMDRRHFC